MSQPGPQNVPLGTAPPATFLTAEPADLVDALATGTDPATLVARDPTFLAGWAALAERSLPSDPVAAYAYARVGYHRGLDRLRQHGWRGAGRVPWSHAGNQGFLGSLRALADAAAALGEASEAERCRVFLRDCDPSLA